MILANLYKIEPYTKSVEIEDFNGKKRVVQLPEGVAVNHIPQYLFTKAKKAKKRSENIYLQRENLLSKIAFYKNLLFAVENAKSVHELELLSPKRARSKLKKQGQKDAELFWIEGYKVLVGRSSKENIALLESAKANDIWMHVKDMPGSHLIIRTDKQNLPDSLLEQAAKLCVDFTVQSSGSYEVDYTKRRYVKITDGSNVNYGKYNTIVVKK